MGCFGHLRFPSLRWSSSRSISLAQMLWQSPEFWGGLLNRSTISEGCSGWFGTYSSTCWVSLHCWSWVWTWLAFLWQSAAWVLGWTGLSRWTSASRSAACWTTGSAAHCSPDSSATRLASLQASCSGFGCLRARSQVSACQCSVLWLCCFSR